MIIQIYRVAKNTVHFQRKIAVGTGGPDVIDRSINEWQHRSEKVFLNQGNERFIIFKLFGA